LIVLRDNPVSRLTDRILRPSRKTNRRIFAALSINITCSFSAPKDADVNKTGGSILNANYPPKWVNFACLFTAGSGNSFIATLVERHSRFVMLAKVENKDTQSVITALIKQARKLPKELYKTLTWDRGSEMTGHRKFTMATKINVYFCDPQSPWQRGSNENTNRLLRQYFPKGIDISAFSQAKLSAVARQLNERPRKTLQYQTPAEKFEACVATTR